MFTLKGPTLGRMAREVPRLQSRFPTGQRPFHDTRFLRSVVKVEPGQQEIEVDNESGIKTKLSLLWLRDHCTCDKCLNRDTMQRSFDPFTTDLFTTGHDSGIMYTRLKKGLRVHWDAEHVSEYPWAWLSERRYLRLRREEREHWNHSIGSKPPSVHYDQIMADDDGVGLWTSKITKYGFCFVDGCPVSPEKTQELLERIAFIRVTHYGGFYDFTSDLTMKDTAYTSLALPPHTDNTYFTEPSGLQMFHLLSHTDGDGGLSILVDGFKCAQLLDSVDPRAYKVLSQYDVPCHSSGNEGITITPSRQFPVLRQIAGNDSMKALMQVRWNVADRATLPYKSCRGIETHEWYRAARLWNSIISNEKNQYRAQLIPRRPLIFDNWRVLHGRTVFSGKRRMCGGYINHDDFVSRYLNTNFERKDILGRYL